MINPFSYTDFRRLLRDVYDDKKGKYGQSFSYTVIARGLGRCSSAFVCQVLNGKCNIGERFLPGLVSTFGFRGLEAHYVTALVRYNQAKTDGEKRPFLEQMHFLRGQTAQKLKFEQFEFYQKWYYSAVWAMLRYHRFRGDYAHLARKLRPRITAAQARRAVRLLVDLGLARVTARGRYVQAASLLTTGDNASAVSLSTFHRKTMDLAKQAIDAHPREHRRLSTLTLAIPAAAFDKVNDVLRACRKAISAIAYETPGPNCVYQVNFQLFPLTEIAPKVKRRK